MEVYKNRSGKSGVRAYKTGDDHIIVHFRNNGLFYKYTHASAGTVAVSRMKALAQSGLGLNSFISTRRPPFARKSAALESVI